MPREVKEEIGRKCKRVLDYSRMDHVIKNGYECSLKNYANLDITLENVCLVGKKKAK